MAYDLEFNNNGELDKYKEENEDYPEIIIVKKTYPRYWKKQKKRTWKLKHMDKQVGVEEEEEQPEPQGKKKTKKNRGAQIEQRAAEHR
jgi:hypothetical protein